MAAIMGPTLGAVKRIEIAPIDVTTPEYEGLQALFFHSTKEFPSRFPIHTISSPNEQQFSPQPARKFAFSSAELDAKVTPAFTLPIPYATRFSKKARQCRTRVK